MATPGELAKVVADTTGVPIARVISTHRYLRDAGLVAKGGRGTSAAAMHPRDAAVLLIGIAVGGEIKETPTRVVEYTRLKADRVFHFDEGETRGADFGGALETLLEIVPRARAEFSAADGPTIRVSIHGPHPFCTIEIDRAGHLDTFIYGTRYSRQFADMRYISEFSQVTIGYVGACLT